MGVPSVLKEILDSKADEVEAGKSELVYVYVNVFNGSERSVVRMRVDEGSEWVELEKTAEPDPHYSAVRQREIAKDPDGKRHLNVPVPSAHLWKGKLPAGMRPGSHLIEIEATDAYGRPHTGKRLIRIVNGAGS